MALTAVPDYLPSLASRSEPTAVSALMQQEQEGELLGDLQFARDALGAWSSDDEFWSSVSGVIADSPTDVPDLLERYSEEELRVITEALGGDSYLAQSVMLQLPPATNRVDQARTTIIIVQRQCEHAIESPPGRGRIWRAAKVLRRVFKAAAGGILIASDIVVPDPTGIVRVASVAGGVDLIIDSVT